MTIPVLIGEGLKTRLSGNTMAHLSHEFCCDVSVLVVVNCGETPIWAAKGMFDTLRAPTKTNGILESTFV